MDQNTGIGLILDPQGGHFSVFDLEIMGGIVQTEVGICFDFNCIIGAVLQGKIGPAVSVCGDGIYQGIIHAADLKGGIRNPFRGLARIDLDDLHAAHGVVVKTEGLRIIGVDGDGLALAVRVDGESRYALQFRYDDGARDTRQRDLTRGVRIIDPVGGQGASGSVHKLPIGVFDFKFDALQRNRCASGAPPLFDHEVSQGLVAELQGHRLSGLDLGSLGCVIQKETIFCPGFFDHKCGAGVDALNEDGPGGIGSEIAVAVAHHRAVALGHKELNIRNRRVIGTGHLFDEQRALGTVAKIDLNNLLILAGEIDRLRRGVDHMRAITGELFYDVSAGFAARDGERAIGRSPVGPDDGAASTGGVAAQVTDLEHSPLNGGSSLTVIFPHGNSRERPVAEAERVPLACGDKRLLRVRVRQSKARRRLQLLYPKPAITEGEVRVGEHDTALFIGVEHAQVVVLSGSGVVGCVPNLERYIFDSIMCD